MLCPKDGAVNEFGNQIGHKGRGKANAHQAMKKRVRVAEANGSTLLSQPIVWLKLESESEYASRCNLASQEYTTLNKVQAV
jgi:hypothetical protein